MQEHPEDGLMYLHQNLLSALSGELHQWSASPTSSTKHTTASHCIIHVTLLSTVFLWAWNATNSSLVEALPCIQFILSASITLHSLHCCQQNVQYCNQQVMSIGTTPQCGRCGSFIKLTIYCLQLFGCWQSFNIQLKNVISIIWLMLWWWDQNFVTVTGIWSCR